MIGTPGGPSPAFAGIIAGVPELYGGVETGGTWCVCALGSGPQDISSYERFPTRSPAETLDHIVEFFASGPSPVAIGVGAFGPVDVHRGSPTWGWVTTTPKPGWQHTSVAPVLSDRLGVPVAFDSDVNAAALGEHRWGAGREVQSLCYLTVGTGIGAGLLVDGRPWHGLIHPEVGHMRIPHDRGRDRFAGSCPLHGDCWEGLAAGGAIAARWGQPPESAARRAPRLGAGGRLPRPRDPQHRLRRLSAASDRGRGSDGTPAIAFDGADTRARPAGGLSGDPAARRADRQLPARAWAGRRAACWGDRAGPARTETGQLSTK